MELRPDYPIRTDRLLIRPLVADDAEAVQSYRGREEVCRYVPFTPMSVDAVLEKIAGSWARTTIENESEAVTLGVELAESGRVIGDVMLFLQSAEHRSGEIGWVLDPAFSGQGYATEAAQAVLGLAFDGLGLHRVTARVDARNGPSIRLAERLGMRREAHLVENEWFKGDWSDEIDFALLDREWAAEPDPAG